MSLRILLCTHAPADLHTAVYRSSVGRAESLKREGHEIIVMTPSDLTSMRFPRLDPFVLPVLLALRKLAAYDVVIFHSYLGWAFHLARRWLDPGRRVVTITSFHGLEPLYLDALSSEARRNGRPLSIRFRLMHAVLARLIRMSCRRSDGVFCLNSTEATYLTRHGWADPDRVYLMANGVEPECFVARTFRVARRLLFVGQWLPAKGTTYLVEAFAAVAAVSDVELVCAGTRAPAAVVLDAFPASVRDRVTILSEVTRDELYAQLSAADVFVFPTLSEGFSIALLEAMAGGLPIVTTPVGAAVDMLMHEQNALIVPTADSPAIVSAIRRLVSDSHLRQRLGGAARTTAMAYTRERASARFMTAVSTLARRVRHTPVGTGPVGEDAVS